MTIHRDRYIFNIFTFNILSLSLFSSSNSDLGSFKFEFRQIRRF